ncbi:alpha/beta fold hydrolase [Lysobacter tyrosinilyticus]
MLLPTIHHRHVDIDGVRVFYREAGPKDAPALLLLHGFPSSSQQFRRLMDALGGRYRLVAPDYPGFGHSDAPLPVSAGGVFEYSFDRLADVIEKFCEAVELRRFVLYMFDFGGPVGMRVAERHPDWISGVIVQNANAYEDGLSPMARDLVALQPGDVAEQQLGHLLTLEMTRNQYLGGTSDATRVAPDGWTLDQHFLDQPGRKRIQIELALDYASNVARYPAWQAWMREHQPPALVVWGRNDAFFPEPGAHAYLRDLPDAEIHLLDTGHFALEEEAPRIATLIDEFVARITLQRSAAVPHGMGREAQPA